MYSMLFFTVFPLKYRFKKRRKVLFTMPVLQIYEEWLIDVFIYLLCGHKTPLILHWPNQKPSIPQLQSQSADTLTWPY
jgi:hypothetical protein